MGRRVVVGSGGMMGVGSVASSVVATGTRVVGTVTAVVGAVIVGVGG